MTLLLSFAACNFAQNISPMKPGQTAQKFHLERKQVLDADYLLYLPDGYGADAAKHWPLILFLHGAGERGSDVWKVAAHGPPKIDTTSTNFPFIVVSPQCPAGKIWSDELLMALLDDIESTYSVDTHRVYLTGLSMGGYGTWSLGMKYPERFAAIAPICGGGQTIDIVLAQNSYDPKRLADLKTLGIWAFHGGKDPVVPTNESMHMVDMLKKAGCTDIKLTIYPNALHDSWTQTYANPDLFQWFLAHSR